ncbi:hypothetical protein KP509_25G011500 [Ceratopteris richardii]|uniref:Uncharacterized protein n=1 Tax=Ceratopteris richardii TaxID=49495 RepID=A0A8T2RQB8_CERRI|nr:hypothetical protein KP509_25G011500 [Ceratopteris richardii]
MRSISYSVFMEERRMLRFHMGVKSWIWDISSCRGSLVILTCNGTTFIVSSGTSHIASNTVKLRMYVCSQYFLKFFIA